MQTVAPGPATRRSARVAEHRPIQVAGSDVQGRGFVITARTVVLSRFGAKIALSRDLSVDQEITVSCAASGAESGARVVSLIEKLSDARTYGIEFLDLPGEFWNVPLPLSPGFEDAPCFWDDGERTSPVKQSTMGSTTAGRRSSSSPQPGSPVAGCKRGRNYAIRLLCPEGDQEQWMFLQNRAESLQAIRGTSWDFRCAVHGRQSAIPCEATETLLEGPPLVRNLPLPAQAPKLQPGKAERRQEERYTQRIRVRVRGTDRAGHPFEQSSYSVDISRRGGRLEGLGALALPGTVVEVRRGWRSALYRVVWIGQIGTPQAAQIGISSMQPDRDLWGLG